jgi:hypothetical protein
MKRDGIIASSFFLIKTRITDTIRKTI